MANNCAENSLPCSGCGVCAVKCPAGAISINLARGGFYEASLNKSKCISCGQCLKVCPKFEGNFPPAKKLQDIPLYAAWSTDKSLQQKSTSGGICGELLKAAFSKGYKAAGVVYDYKQNKAKTVIASNLEEAAGFKGSKYLQSFTFEAFKHIAGSKDKFIIFCTPCQAAGLSFLAKEHLFDDRIIIVDFFCHGVPSYILWDGFLKWLPFDKLSSLNFRSKKHGWHGYAMEINQKTIALKDNPFYTLYFSDLLLCGACYECGAKANFSLSDIRVGDFWGSAFDNREDGVSIAAPLSAKGQALIEALCAGGSICRQPQKWEAVIKTQSAFKKTPVNLAFRAQLFDAFKTAGIEGALSLYLSRLSFKRKLVYRVKKYLPRNITKVIKKALNKLRFF